eukprot:1159237-Pelagomonas_calceolata.AAC.4
MQWRGQTLRGWHEQQPLGGCTAAWWCTRCRASAHMIYVYKNNTNVTKRTSPARMRCCMVGLQQVRQMPCL